ncbi:MAG: glycosyltransferase [Acidobacteria bacterium]|nr:glycosyltransferase [Acidobacteriota bacterium]
MIQVSEAENVVVSVVIPSYNEQEHIGECLHSVLNQQTELAYDVVVVDSSTDATPQIIAQEFPSVKLIHCGQRASPAQARNLGIQQARAPVVAFIDADCTADPFWIEAITGAHQNSYPAIGGSISLATPWTWAGAILFVIEFSEYLPPSSAREIRWLPSCNLSVKRDALEKHGGFPTHMEASEDMLFSRHLMAQSGSPLWFDPQIKIAHMNCHTLGDLQQRLRKLGYWSGRSRGSGIIPGGFLLQNSLLIPLLVPYRLAVIFARLVVRSGHKRLFALCLLCWPLMVYGLICWARAFWRGVREAREQAP